MITITLRGMISETIPNTNIVSSHFGILRTINTKSKNIYKIINIAREIYDGNIYHDVYVECGEFCFKLNNIDLI